MDASQNGGGQEEEDIEVDVEMISDSEDEPPGGSQTTDDSSPTPPPPPQIMVMVNDGDETMTTDDDYDEEDEDEELRHSSSENGAILRTRPFVAVEPANFWATLTPPSYLPGGYARNRGDPLSRSLRVFSIALLPNPRPELENGGKIILPPSFLGALTRPGTQMNGAMLFRVCNDAKEKQTHCGVLEFIAEEGRCYMPFWRMCNIGAKEGDLVTVTLTTAGIGTFALFEPQSVDFLDISNPKALLENTLRNFACLTKGEIIVIRYNSRIYELKVLDTKPTDAINIIECDLDVDFAPAIGLPLKESSSAEESSDLVTNDFIPFIGAGSRLNGKPVIESPSTTVRRKMARGQPDYDWAPGNLTFIRKLRNENTNQERKVKDEEQKKFTAFTGQGSTLNGGKL